MRTRFVLVLLIFIIHLCATYKYLLVFPMVWPDEAIFSEMAHNILTEGRNVTHLWGDTIAHIEDHSLFYPPMLMYTIAPVQYIFGQSIIAQRMLAVVAGLIVLLMLNRHTIAQHTSNRLAISILPLMLFITNVQVEKITRFTRPEVFVIASGLVSMYLFTLSLHKKSRSILLLFTSGIFTGLAVLYHFLGAIFALTITFTVLIHIKKFSVRQRAAYASGVLLVMTAWLADVFANWEIFQLQSALGYIGKTFTMPWVLADLSSKHPSVLALTLLYIVTSCLIFVSIGIFWHRSKRKIDPTITLTFLYVFFSWAVSITGRSDMYYAYPIIAVIYALTVVFSLGIDNNYKRMLAACTCAIMLVQIIQTEQFISLSLGKNLNYDKFASKVASNIPNNSTVLLSSIPDPYFSLVNKKGVRLYEFPALATPIDKYEKLLASSDYIVFNGNYAYHLFNNFLSRYIEKNKESFEVVREGGYQTTIFKLKDKNSRITDL